MTLQTSGTINTNEIIRELKGYTANGTLMSLGSDASRRMAGGPAGPTKTGSISMSDFYGKQSHIGVVVGTVVIDYGSYSTLTGGYIKDYYGNGSHLGSLSTDAGVYIPSSGATNNLFSEREVIECYTVYYNNSSIRDFYLKLQGQEYSQNIFTGIRELNASGSITGMATKALADATFSTATSGNAWSQWKWTTTERWTNGTKYIHWY